MDNSPGGARVVFAGGAHTYSYNNISTAPQLVVNSAPGRGSIEFHNPGPNDIFVAPTIVQNNGVAPLPAGVGSDVTLTPSLAALGGCFRIYGNGGQLVISGPQAGRAWNAFAATGTTNPLTVLNSNVQP